MDDGTFWGLIDKLDWQHEDDDDAVVDVRNQSAARRPSSPAGQPSHAWVTDSTNVSQSRSMRLRSACVPDACIVSR